jgi:hypothetical protein
MPVDPTPGYVRSPAPKRKRKKKQPDLRRIVGSAQITPGPKPVVRDPNPITKAVEATTQPAQIVAQKNKLRTILRRQRLLKSLGYYKGEIDGAWGVQAQTAWSKFVYRKRRGWQHPAGAIPAVSPVAAERREQRQGVVSLVRRQAQQAKADAARVVSGQKLAEPVLTPAEQKKKDEQDAVLARKLKIEKARNQIVGDAKALRTNPQIAAKVSLRRITDVVADPTTKWSVQNKADVLFVQHHLTRLHPLYTPTGVWDEATSVMLQNAIEKDRQATRRKAIDSTRKYFYDSGILEAGTRPSWWRSPGAIPEPGKLLDLLQKGDFNSDKLLAEITWQAKQDRFVFPGWRSEQLQALALRTAPFGASRLNAMFGPASGVQDWQLANDVIGLTAPLLNADSNKDERTAKKNAQKYVMLRAQVKALQRSGGFEDFKRRLEGLVFREELGRTEQMKAAAADDTFSWGNLFAVAVSPFETLFEGVQWAQTAGIYTALSATQKVDKALHFLRRDDYGDVRNVQWEDAMTLMGDDPHESVDGYDDGFDMRDVPGGALTVFTMQLAADPTNFLGPLKLGSTALRKTVGVKQLGTYVKNEVPGGASSFQLAKRKDLVGGALIYQGKTWKAGSVVAVVDRAAGGSMFQHVPSLVMAESVVRRLAKTRIEANLVARSKVALAARQGFRPTVRMVDGKAKTIPAAFTIKDPQTRRWQDEAEAELGDIFSGPDYKDFVDTIVRERASLWLNSDRVGSQTSIGAAMEAQAFEITRTNAIWDVASDHARRIWDREFATFREQGYNVTKARQMANEIAQNQYDNILGRAGSYFTGPEDADLLVEIQARQMAVMDDFQNTIMVQLQNYVEKRMDAEGIALWNHEGKWWGAKSGTQVHLTEDGTLSEPFEHQAGDVIKERVRSAFADAEGVLIDNPAYGKAFSFEQMMVMAGGEVRRRQQRVIRYVARESEAGTLPLDFDYDARLAQLHDDVMLDWEERGGKWYDTREQVKESDLYLRHLAKELHPRLEYELDTSALNALKKAMGTRGIKVNFNVVDDIDATSLPGTGPVYGFYATQGPAAGQILVHVPSRIMFAKDEFVARDIYMELTDTISHELFHSQQHLSLGHIIGAKKKNENVRHIDEFTGPGRYDYVEQDAEEFGNKMAAAYAEAGVVLFKATGKPPTYGRASLERIMQTGDDPVRVQGVGSYDVALRKLLWDMGSTFRTPQFADWEVENAADSVKFAMRARGDKPTREATMKRRQKLTQAVTKNQTYLAQASTDVMAQALRGELAFWMALRESEQRPAKVIASAAQGWSDFWLFSTLALRPAWTVKNEIDNLVKGMLAGMSDPRLFFAGAKNPGSGLRSIFDGDIRALLAATEFLDNLMGSNGKMVGAVKAATDRFWELPTETIQKIFSAHGLREVPDAIIDASRQNPFERPKIEKIATVNLGDPKLLNDPKLLKAAEKHQRRAATEPGMYERFRSHFFDLLGNRPEAFRKRMIYRSSFEKSMRDVRAQGIEPDATLQIRAHDIAWAEVEKYLFDYSKISVIEDNFRFFLPFIQFWRKNSLFWIAQAADKAWIAQDLLKYEEMREEMHADLPEWMRRYWSATELTDKLGYIPGFEGIVGHLGLEDAMYDPMNYLSFAPLYRAFKQENPNLPPDKEGNRFFGGMIDAMSEWGLGMNPAARSALETAGIAHERAWQFMFPQTGLAVAISRKHFGDRWADRVADWESLWGALGTTPSNSLAENFNFHVQMHMAEQVSKGGEANRAAAEDFVRDLFYLQNIHGYFTGMYYRNGNPAQIHLTKLHDDVLTDAVEIEDLSPADKKAWSLWSLRGADRYSFDKYTDAYPKLQAFFRIEDYDRRQAYLQKNPEINKYIDPVWTGNAFSTNYVTGAALNAGYFKVSEAIENLHLPYESRITARNVLLTPELQAHWDKHSTPEGERRRMIQAEAYRHEKALNATYFAIPDSDFAAKQEFIASNPELVRGWNRNNDKGDDYEVLINTANADIRDAYFSILGEKGQKPNWDAAAAFARQYAFAFDGTKLGDRLDADGHFKPRNPERRNRWLAAKAGIDHYVALRKQNKDAANTWLRSNDPDAKLALAYFTRYPSGKKGKVSEHGRAYLAVKPQMQKFDALVAKVGEDKAFDILFNSKEPWAVEVVAYMKKWGKQGDKTGFAVAYNRIKPLLRTFLDMPRDKQKEFLAGKTPEAKRLRKFLDKYMSEDGITEQGFAWLEAKPSLEKYGALREKHGKDYANKWLQSDDKDAKIALDYMKRFTRQSKAERAFRKHPGFEGGSPETQKRMAFWKAYYNLDPDQRQKFVMDEAENHGVFVYGAFGEQERHDAEAAWNRRAIGAGMSKRQAAYLYVRPLLDFYMKLDPKDRTLFARLNPEIRDYLDKYATKSPTGNKKLDKLVEGYFKLPPSGAARTAWLRAHPEVQDYFDRRSTPAERALRNVLEQYFGLHPGEREDFLIQHPEIPEYFDQKRRDDSMRNDQADAFDRADPRLEVYFDSADDAERSAEEMRRKLRQAALNALTPDTIEYRRDGRRLSTL